MLPSALRGTLYRVGPGLLSRGGVKYASPLDGDGRIDKLRFDGGRVHVVSRFVETAQWLQEEQEGRVLHRGAFGTAPHLSLRTLKNPANTALVHHGGELLALWEGGCAHAVDLETLACLGPHNLGGAARLAPALSVHPAIDGLLRVGGDAVCAHTRRCPATGRLVMLLTRYSLGATLLRFVEFAPDSFTPLSERTHSFAGFTAVHDFAVTADSYVFFAPPLDFDASGFRRGRGALECVSQRPEPTRLVLLPRRGDGAALESTAPRCFVTHLLRASETADAAIVECCATNELGPEMLPTAFRARRFTVDKASGRASFDTMLHCLAEFPVLDAAGEGYCAATADAPMDSWARLSDGRLSTVRGGFHTEPVLACGFLVGLVMLHGEPWLRAVEADTMREAGRVRAEGVNPLGLHGLWVDYT
jgi:all-trans-8'-apo-beta-carotenal 15,15'-oxygenase